jgi:hypothetical protein
VTYDSLIQAAVDEALAANPDVAEKIRGGKVAAAGAVVGAVMKATKGQADAARVRELVLKACSWLRRRGGCGRRIGGRVKPDREERGDSLRGEGAP